MSYDVQVWSVKKPDALSSLPKSASWKARGDCWALEKRHWQIVCGPPDVVFPEDVPEVVLAGMPGISFLTEFNLEPIDAPETATKELLRAARSVAKASHGLVYDPQTDELTTPRGVKRFVPEARSERSALLKMGWWFLGNAIFTPAGMDGLLDVIATLLPDALPKRYGLYEPPLHILANEGRKHLSAFLLEHLEKLLLLYPHRPVMELNFACTRDYRHPSLGFRCNHVSVDIEASVMTQPGWQDGVRRFWLAICSQLNSFYAESRTLNGYVRTGSDYWVDMETDVHPIRSWFWHGIPIELGHAIAIGPPYTDLWPRARAEGQALGDLIVLDTGIWVEDNNLVLQAPEDIRQAWTPEYNNDSKGVCDINWVTEYPSIWPFGTE